MTELAVDTRLQSIQCTESHRESSCQPDWHTRVDRIGMLPDAFVGDLFQQSSYLCFYAYQIHLPGHSG